MLEKDGWVIRSEDKDAEYNLFSCGCGCALGFVLGVLSGFFMYGFWKAFFSIFGWG